MLNFARSAFAFAFPLAALLLALSPLVAQDPRPNIVYIFSDDHAERAISACGGDLNQTPNIDRIAREGVIFRKSFCANSICAPSRATVLTGQHSHTNGKMTNGDRFDPRRSRLPLALQGAGYRTAIFGKWHLQCDPMGFDDWEVLPGQGHYYNPDFRSAAGRRRIPGHVTEIITDLATDWLRTKRKDGEPFLLMVQHKAPHRNWMPGPKELDLYRDADLPEPPTLFDDGSQRTVAFGRSEMSIDRHLFWTYDLKVPRDLHEGMAGPIMKGRWARNEWERMSETQRAAFDEAYRAENEALAKARPAGKDLVRWKYQRYVKDYLRCVAGVDRSVGVILDELDRLGLSENTLVVYSSDQGFYLGEHGWYDKRWIFDESMRMPLMMRWPGKIDPGTEVYRLVQNIDHAPTLLHAAGVAEGRQSHSDGSVGYEMMHGRSLLTLLADERRSWDGEEWRDALYYAYHEVGIHAVEPHDGVRAEWKKIVWFPRTKEWQYFDLDHDPNELTDLMPSLSPENDELGFNRRDFCFMTRRYIELRHETGAQTWPVASNLEVYDDRGVPRRRKRSVAEWTVHEDRRFRLSFWDKGGARFTQAIDDELRACRGVLTRELARRLKGAVFVVDVEADPFPELKGGASSVCVRDVTLAERQSVRAVHVEGIHTLLEPIERSNAFGYALAGLIIDGLSDEEKVMMGAIIKKDFSDDPKFAFTRFRSTLGGWIRYSKERSIRLEIQSPAMRSFICRVAGIKITQRSR